MKRVINWLFRDGQGKIAIIQRPNLPLIGWIATTLAAHILQNGKLHSFLLFCAKAFLFTWAYLEITKGRSGIRRILGGIVLLYLLWIVLLSA